ncbi:MAG: LuxR C-terminal-related transcriptional regulator [Desulfovibrionaceae bacterium]|nr:LuxR C-terminal-related transcriptional regulator [Desulfovibrionaceae bacterium]
MFSYIKKILEIRNNDSKYSINLRRRLILYLVLMAVGLLSCALLLVFTLNLSPSGDNVAVALAKDLSYYEERLSAYFGDTAARGIHLSTLAAREMERTLAEHGASFDDISDNPRLITALQRNTFAIVRNTLLFPDCSGAFIIFDATVNTSLPGSEHSRCGLYLKLANITVSRPVNPGILWTRGTHEVALENGLIFHNKWELEFATQRMPFYRKVIESASKNLMEGYYYHPAMRLHGTSEQIMALFVPIVGKDGRTYGACGFEISAMFFKLMHPVSADPDARITGLIARRQGQTILSGSGLEAGVASGYFADLGNGDLRTEQEGPLTTFSLPDGRTFVGMYKKTTLSPPVVEDAGSWVVACFIPKEDYIIAIYKNNAKILLYCVAIFGMAGVLCWYISRKCIVPLVSGIDAVKAGVAQKTNIHEIDDLLDFLAMNSQVPDVSVEDVDMSAFYAFRRNIDTLSKMEKSVFDLYLQGHSTQEIAEELHISINTIKFHNKNIYRKLNVPSRKALMLYVQMMRRVQG